jgi:orotate phosphoribosyltransferase
MSSLDDLIAKAKLLHADGHTPNQIADELNLSIETTTWLLTQQKGGEVPKDVHIDWTAVSTHADLLGDIAIMMLKRFLHAQIEGRGGERVAEDEPDVLIGVAQSGIPIATLIASEYDAQIAIYHPAKHAAGERAVGSMSGNFAQIRGERCLIVDDVITSGRTMKEMVEYLRKHGAHPLAIAVIFDKRGLQDVDGVPVYSLFKISRID